MSEEVLDRRDELLRVERLLEKGVRPRGQRPLAEIQARDAQQRRPAPPFQSVAQLSANPPGDHQLDDRQRGLLGGELRLRILSAQRYLDLVALGTEKEVVELGPAAIALRQQDLHSRGRTRHRPLGERLRARPAFGEQAVGVGGGQTLVEALHDEPQLLYLLARVEPAPALAALGHHEPVAILPTADRRLRDPQHPRHRTDAVDATSANHAASLSHIAPFLRNMQPIDP